MLPGHMPQFLKQLLLMISAAGLDLPINSLLKGFPYFVPLVAIPEDMLCVAPCTTAFWVITSILVDDASVG